MQSLSGSSFWTFPVIMSAAAVTESESQQISSHKPRSPASPEEALSGGVTSTRGRGAVFAESALEFHPRRSESVTRV